MPIIIRCPVCDEPVGWGPLPCQFFKGSNLPYANGMMFIDGSLIGANAVHDDCAEEYRRNLGETTTAEKSDTL